MALEAAGAEGSSDQIMREVDAGEILGKIQARQPVEYDHVIVRGDLDLSRVQLQKNVTSPIRINDSMFYDLVNFNGTTFEKPVDLSGSNFAMDVFFREVAFSGYANFEGATFSGYVSFSEATFGDNVNFEEVTFSDYASFSEATFTDYASFGEVTFGDNARFGEAEFWHGAGFWEATFRDDVNFLGTSFNDDTSFRMADFGGEADFREVTFSGYANFAGAELRGEAEFYRATFSGDADFGAYFSGNAEFYWATFGGEAEFGGAEFRGDADFDGAEFSGEADFDEAEFSGEAKFIGATFNGDAYYERAAFIGNSSFQDAEFNGNIEFSDARFKNETSFYRILFKRPAYFEDCSIKSLNLTKAEYSRLHLRWDGIESLHFDEAAYLALIKNYNTLGWYGDANDCYYDYRNAVRNNWMAASSPGFSARLSNLLDWFIDFMEWLLYGYGVKPSFPIAWSAGIVLAFGLFFRHKKCLRKIITEERIEESEEASDEVLVKSIARRAEIKSLDPFLFSLFTFTSGFTSFLHPGIEYKLERCVRWAIFERLLGPFFMALMITTISKTYLIR